MPNVAERAAGLSVMSLMCARIYKVERIGEMYSDIHLEAVHKKAGAIILLLSAVIGHLLVYNQ